MKQAIRALGLAIYIFWLVVIVFAVTIVYSATQLGVKLDTENSRTSTSGGTMVVSVPFSMENKGFYDISDLNITTIIHESNGVLVSNSSTVVSLISSGSKVDETHKISISLDKMSPASLSRLLFNDTNFDIDWSLALSYARVIPLKISTNSKMEWGAPLYNLDIGDIPTPQDYNISHVQAILPISFENHSFFTLNGNMRIEIINTLNQRVGGSTTHVTVPSESSYSNRLPVYVTKGSGNFKEARLYFDFTPIFSYGPKVISIG